MPTQDLLLCLSNMFIKALENVIDNNLKERQGPTVENELSPRHTSVVKIFSFSAFSEISEIKNLHLFLISL